MNLSKMLVSIKIHLPIYTTDEGVICGLNAMLLVSPSPLICLSTETNGRCGFGEQCTPLFRL